MSGDEDLSSRLFGPPLICTSCGGPLIANKPGHHISFTYTLTRHENGFVSDVVSGLCGPCIEKAEAQTTRKFVCGTCKNHPDARCDFCGNNLPPGRYPLRDTTR